MADVPETKKSSSRHHNINIGLVVFIAIFIYMAANTIGYFMRGHVSFFEVEQGEIVNEDRFSGFILRDEQTAAASDSGYISYYVNDSEKAAKNENVCLINKADSAKSKDSDSDTVYSLTDSDISDIRDKVLNFNKTYTDSDYSEVTNLRYDLNNIVSQIVSRENIDTLGESGNYTVMTSTSYGVISYTTDGMEGYTRDNISPELFNTNRYDKHQTEAGSSVKSGDSVYKIILDDNWQIIIKPDEDQLKRIQKIIDDAQTNNETPSIDVNFINENLTASADIETFDKDGNTYVALCLSDYMVRFCSDRYVNINLVWDTHTGLKFPVTSLAKRDYYMIPIEYLVTDDSSSQKGFYIQTDSGTVFTKYDIALSNDDYCYVDCDDMETGTVLIDNNTKKTFSVSTTSALSGVYNINQGYTKFCLISEYTQYGDYCIVDNDVAAQSGLSIYDRIILDGESVENNEIVY